MKASQKMDMEIKLTNARHARLVGEWRVNHSNTTRKATEYQALREISEQTKTGPRQGANRLPSMIFPLGMGCSGDGAVESLGEKESFLGVHAPVNDIQDLTSGAAVGNRVPIGRQKVGLAIAENSLVEMPVLGEIIK